MRLLSEEKLKAKLAERHLSLRELATQAGISRQSIYSMFHGAPIYSVPFYKIIQSLKIDTEAITSSLSQQEEILKRAPLKIKKAVLEMQRFCQAHEGSLFLFGSQATGRAHPSSDWDFGAFFHKQDHDKSLRLLKVKLQDHVFPYRLDLLNLTGAPAWFINSIREEAFLMMGQWPQGLGGTHGKDR